MVLACTKTAKGAVDKGSYGHTGMYHPYKLSRGLDGWNYMFDALNP